MTTPKRPSRKRQPTPPADTAPSATTSAADELPPGDRQLLADYRVATAPAEQPAHFQDRHGFAQRVRGQAVPDTQHTGDSPADSAEERPAADRSPNPFAVRSDYTAGVHLLEDRKFRQMQLRFDSKPAEPIRQAMAETGFRWRGAEGVWTKQIEAGAEWRTRADANALFERVTALIREHHLPAEPPAVPARGRT